MEAVSSLVEAAQQLPLPLLVAAATLLSLAGLLVLRVISNSFPGKAPPVDEGSIPFIGGLLKFSKVRCAPQKGGRAPGLVQLHQPPPLPAAAGGEQRGHSGWGACLSAAAAAVLDLCVFRRPVGTAPCLQRLPGCTDGWAAASVSPPASLRAHACPAAAASLASLGAHYQHACLFTAFPRLQGPLPLMTEMYAKHGEVFTIPLLHKKMTFLVGPHVAPHFFNATDDKMSQTEVQGTGRGAGRGGRQGGVQGGAKWERAGTGGGRGMQQCSCRGHAA